MGQTDDRLQTNKLQHFIALIQCTLATRWHSNNDWSLFNHGSRYRPSAANTAICNACYFGNVWSL